MKKRLSHKEKGFVRDIVKGKTGIQAILDNYDTTDKKVAGVMAVQNLEKLRIQEAIKSIADSIPDDLLVERHLELLNKRDVLFGADTQAVKAGLEMAYKLKGSYAPDKLAFTDKKGEDLVSKEQAEELLALLRK